MNHVSNKAADAAGLSNSDSITRAGKMQSPAKHFAPKLKQEVRKFFSGAAVGTQDLICLSHLRWDFVFQRPQHLMTRAAQARRVFFFEEPIFTQESLVRLDIEQRENVWVVVPHLPEGLSADAIQKAQADLLTDLCDEFSIEKPILWYYTAMAVPFSSHIDASVRIYDCMDELSLFKNAPGELVEHERKLLQLSDLVFTGGQSLYEAKKHRHPSVHAFPSSIDHEHFRAARSKSEDPEDQREIPYPRMGFFGVIDERLDIELLAQVAAARPDWSLVMIGPVVKIDHASLPKNPNIYYLGQKSYKELPQYLAGWNVAMMPFAKNDSTRFISPTKTPEYLAAGKPVISTSIQDVVRPYGEQGLVSIADDPANFIRKAAECGMDENTLGEEWRAKVDRFLNLTSWDKTWHQMETLIREAIVARGAVSERSEQQASPAEQTSAPIETAGVPGSGQFAY